ncbi:MAG TPA: protease [Thermoanaerobaculia bacterium]
MDSFFRSLAYLALAACAAAAPSARSEVRLKATLAAQPSYRIGGPVRLAFTLENLSAEPVWVLVWYTPLEGIKGDIFRVSRDGTALRYQGPMVKRGDPSVDAYRRVEPGKPLTAEVDLARAYDLSAPGVYRVELTGPLRDVAQQGEAVPCKRDEQRPLEVQGSAATFRMVPP